MVEYRVRELDLSTRQAIACEMLQTVEERGWGRVSEQAQKYQVLRTLLYKIREQAQRVLASELAPSGLARLRL